MEKMIADELSVCPEMEGNCMLTFVLLSKFKRKMKRMVDLTSRFKKNKDKMVSLISQPVQDIPEEEEDKVPEPKVTVQKIG
jgi:hypothetical protein